MNYDSCKMVRVESAQAVNDGVPGAFFIETVNEGGEFKRLWAKLPNGEVVGFNLDPAPEHVPYVWKWNFNESKPTLWLDIKGQRHDVNLRGRWHGKVQTGKLVSLEKPT